MHRTPGHRSLASARPCPRLSLPALLFDRSITVWERHGYCKAKQPGQEPLPLMSLLAARLTAGPLHCHFKEVSWLLTFPPVRGSGFGAQTSPRNHSHVSPLQRQQLFQSRVLHTQPPLPVGLCLGKRVEMEVAALQRVTPGQMAPHKEVGQDRQL